MRDYHFKTWSLDPKVRVQDPTFHNSHQLLYPAHSLHVAAAWVRYAVDRMSPEKRARVFFHRLSGPRPGHHRDPKQAVAPPRELMGRNE